MIEFLTTLEGLIGLGIIIVTSYFWAYRRYKNHIIPSRVQKLIDELNSLQCVKPYLEIKRFTNAKLKDLGDLEVTEECKQRSDEIHAEIMANPVLGKRIDEVCAVPIDDLDWSGNPVILEHYSARYSLIKAIRETGATAKIISANGLIICPDGVSLLLHKRSKDVSSDKLKKHTFGGGVQPRGYGPQRDSSLMDAAERELREETGASFHIESNTPVFLIDEFGVEFVQGSFLGINSTKNQIDRVFETPDDFEGDPFIMSPEQLEEAMKNPNGWTISGWVQIMLWLGMGCPGAKTLIRFNNKSPQTLYRDIIESLH
jgi:hypothetical protein